MTDPAPPVPSGGPETAKKGRSETSSSSPSAPPAGRSRREILDSAAATGRTGVLAALNGARQDRGQSYRALAKEISLPSTTIHGWLTGRALPQISLRADFHRLVQHLGLTDPPGTPGGVTAEDWWDLLHAASTWRSDDAPPYPGIRPYTLESAHLFSGRGDQVAQLRSRLTERLTQPQRPLLLVLGRSGVGKSSLVAATVAGLDLAARSRMVTPGGDCLRALEDLRGGTLQVLVVDQAEMLWTPAAEELRPRVLELVSDIQATTADAALVLVVRAESLASVTDVEVLRDAMESASFVLGPITHEDAEHILLDPTSGRGVTMAPGVVELILRDAGISKNGILAPESERTSSLALISQTMRSIWEERRAPDQITVEDYQRTGGVASSVERNAEAAFASLDAEGQAMTWPIFREMITLLDVTPTRRAVPLDTWEDEVSHQVLAAFLDARVLSLDGQEVSLSHDLLLSMWPRLVEWIGTVREWSAARKRLSRFATFWDESGRPDDLLTSTSAVLLLESVEGDSPFSQPDHALSQVEHDFLLAGKAAQGAALERATRENRALRTSRRRFRLIAAVASVALLVSLLATGSMVSTVRSLNTARAVALAGQIAYRSQTVAETMPSRAAQLSIGAFEIADTPTSRSQLLSLTSTPLPRRLATSPGPGAVAATDSLLVKVGTDGHLLLIDPLSGEVDSTIEAPASHLYAVSIVDAGGRTLVAASGEDEDSEDGSSSGCVWEVSPVQRRLGCAVIPAKSDSAVVLEDGSGVLFGAGDGTIQRLRLTVDSAEQLTEVPGPSHSDAPAAVMGIDSRGGTVLVTTIDGSIARLSDPLGDAEYGPVGAIEHMLDVSLSSDGTEFAAGTTTDVVQVGTVGDDAAPPAVEVVDRGFESWVNRTAILPDGRIAAVSSDQTIRTYLADGTPSDLRTLSSLPTSVALSGSRLITYAVDGSVTIWPGEAFAAPSERGRSFQVASDAAGRSLAATVGSRDGILRVQRLERDGGRVDLPLPDEAPLTPYAVAASPDGTLVAAGGLDGELVLRGVTDSGLSEATVVEALGDGEYVTSLAFADSGDRIAVVSEVGESIRVYDLSEDPRSGGAGVTAELTAEIPGPSGGAVIFLDQDHLVIDTGLRELRIVDLRTGEDASTITVHDELFTMVAPRPGYPGQIAFSTDARRVGLIDLGDPRAPSVLVEVTDVSDTPRSIAFSSDGELLAIAAVSHVDVREVDDDGAGISESILRLVGPSSSHIEEARFFDGDSRLAAATYDGTLWWWDIDVDRAMSSTCDAVGDPLSLEEAEQLAPALPSSATMCTGTR